MKKVHVLGNSHVRYFLGHAPTPDKPEVIVDEPGHIELTVMQLGTTGATIWGLLNDDSLTGAGPKIAEHLRSNFGQIDTVVFVLGEVDVRGHVYKHIDDHNQVQSVVKKIVERYERFIVERLIVPGLIDPKATQICLFGALNYAKEYLANSLEAIGPMVIVQASMVFDVLARELCVRRGWKFLSVFEETRNKDGYVHDDCMMNVNKSVDPHMNSQGPMRILVRDKLREIVL